ncbi:MAG: STAS domain-containing protein [Planctomycetota bacterium]
MQVAEIRQGARVLLRPDGPLIGPSSRELSSIVERLLRQGRRSVAIDMSRAGTVDSHGLESLLGAAEALAGVGSLLVIEKTNPIVRSVLEMTGVSRSLEVLSESDAETAREAA